MGSVVQVYPGPPFAFANGVALSSRAVALRTARRKFGDARLALAKLCFEACDRELMWVDRSPFGFARPRGRRQSFAGPSGARPARQDQNWGCSSAGRAPALQAGGQRFDPAQLHHLVVLRAVARQLIDDKRHPFEKSKFCENLLVLACSYTS